MLYSQKVILIYLNKCVFYIIHKLKFPLRVSFKIVFLVAETIVFACYPFSLPCKSWGRVWMGYLVYDIGYFHHGVGIFHLQSQKTGSFLQLSVKLILNQLRLKGIRTGGKDSVVHN